MFSNANSKQPLYLELPESDCRRSTFRIEPQQQMPANLLIEGSTVDIKNISAEGIAFYLGDVMQSDAEEGATFNAVRLFLGGQDDNCILVNIEVLEKTDKLYRCRLNAIDHQSHMAICRYVVEHQKSEIRGEFETPSEQ